MGSEIQQQLLAAPVAAAAAAAEHPSWSEYNQRWFNIWHDGLQKGQQFDKGAPSPQLMQLLSSGQLQVQGKRALVPGCGRGYDVVAFAAAGASLSVGLDICPDAIAAANKQCDEQLAGHPDAAKVSAATELAVADFFSYCHSSGQLFNVGYDYTFLCALHPDMRSSWAEGWARLLQPGGELLTMVYPVDPSRDANTGPPWPVTPDLYKQLLPPAGFELVSLEPIPAGLSHEGRQGREWLGRWRRQ
uniref:Uncharacterized protein n=1 Tax=Tetradesmus obliquus TaxID=3088 RepID=A0A383W5P7_TETOB|eukprot:jgi/Sobl393_1/6064/SZX72965.1